MSQFWRLDGPVQTLILAAEQERLPQVIYWGTPLPASEDCAALAAAHAMDITGGMLDANPELSICPEASQTFPGQPGLICRDAQGRVLRPNFRFSQELTQDNSLCLTYADKELGLTYEAHFELTASSNMLTCWSRLTAMQPLMVNWLAAPVFPATQLSDAMIGFSGRWIGEFQTHAIPWRPGIHKRESRTGRSGHEHFPGLILPEVGAHNTTGRAYGFHYGWSGGHQMIAEELPDGRRQIQFGHASDSHNGLAQSFETAKLYAVFSDKGLNGCGTAFQRHLRDHILTFPEASLPRPVHYNCWEAIYFDHDLDSLKDIATRAKRLGAERFVLDDGWFGRRDDDSSSLGDWQIDPRKYPNGLDPLVDHVTSLGMQFGLWVEPEMVNPDSDLFRAHPDWILGPKDQLLGRQQMVLDLARKEVITYLYDCISTLLETYNISYLKWDHNRILPLCDVAQTEGIYVLLTRLRAAFPHVEIESCASGGGRIDFGILQHCQRVWLSDSNDALERSHIQHGAALFLPSLVTGSHVGPRLCHTSGRVFDMRYRAWVAAQRHMGFEMDPRELEPQEAQVLTEVTQWYKDNRDWLATADILRLDTADPSVLGEMQLAADGSRFVVFSNQLDSAQQILPRPLCLTALDPEARYSLRLRNRDEASNLSRGAPLLKSQDLQASGVWLMTHGLHLPYAMPGSIWVVEGRKL